MDRQLPPCRWRPDNGQDHRHVGSGSIDGLHDASNKEIVKGIFGAAAGLAASGGHVAYIHDTGTNLEINLPRTDISSAAQIKKGLMKRAAITMNDGTEFTFDYGMLSPKKLISAVNG